MKMKYSLSVITAVILFFGCSKSNNVKSNSTIWAFNGTIYTAVTTDYYDSNSNLALLGGTDAKGNYIDIFFNSHPTTNGTYNLTNGKLGSGESKSNCAIMVGNNNSSYQYNSTGKSGETLSVTFNNGKIEASFNDITIEDAGDTTIVTGVVMLK